MKHDEILTEMLRISGRIELCNKFLKHFSEGKTNMGLTLPGAGPVVTLTLSPEGVAAFRNELINCLNQYETKYSQLKLGL